jgi:putative component of membrane protein insertase Oxa1/YidC/SpoIIIJ protein YidD
VTHVFRKFWHLPRDAAIAAITLYQATLSPDHGPLKGLHPYGYCRHEPTCSMFAKKMLEQRGLVLGMIRSIARVLTCHPWKKVSPGKFAKIIDV